MELILLTAENYGKILKFVKIYCLLSVYHVLIKKYFFWDARKKKSRDVRCTCLLCVLCFIINFRWGGIPLGIISNVWLGCQNRVPRQTHEQTNCNLKEGRS